MPRAVPATPITPSIVAVPPRLALVPPMVIEPLAVLLMVILPLTPSGFVIVMPVPAMSERVASVFAVVRTIKPVPLRLRMLSSDTLPPRLALVPPRVMLLLVNAAGGSVPTSLLPINVVPLVPAIGSLKVLDVPIPSNGRMVAKAPSTAVKISLPPVLAEVAVTVMEPLALSVPFVA